MKAGFVIGLGICVLAGFNSQWLRNYDPSRSDGISRVGEPDWEAEEEIMLAQAEETVEKGEATEESEDAEEAGGRWVSLGDDWVITYYCPLECCNEQWAWQTSTQSPMQLHHTIAVDPTVIPYFSKVKIGGLDYEYVAEDCGGGIKGKRIDVLVENCDIANEMGVDRGIEVWVQE